MKKVLPALVLLVLSCGGAADQVPGNGTSSGNNPGSGGTAGTTVIHPRVITIGSETYTGTAGTGSTGTTSDGIVGPGTYDGPPGIGGGTSDGPGVGGGTSDGPGIGRGPASRRAGR